MFLVSPLEAPEVTGCSRAASLVNIYNIIIIIVSIYNNFNILNIYEYIFIYNQGIFMAIN